MPDERKLPGESATGGAGSLPTEAALPGQTDSGDAPPQQPAGEAMPDETALPQPPGDDVVPPPDAIRPDDGAAAEAELSPGGLRPWLRLRFDGHTGVIRTLALGSDGNAMVSAGEDKEVHVWMRRPQRDDAEADAAADEQLSWYHRRAIRWQIERGDRGRIYATAMHGRRLALAGAGALDGHGEIWIVDLDTGELVRSLVDFNNGHQQVIASLAWQPVETAEDAEAEPAPTDEQAEPADVNEAAAAKRSALPALASADVEGRVLFWTADPDTGIWSPRTIVPSDRDAFGEEYAAGVAPQRRFLPITFLGNEYLLVPRHVGFAAEQDNALTWHLQRINLSDNSSDILAIPHLSMVTTMRASADGRLLVSADAAGQVHVTRFAEPDEAPQTQTISPLEDVVVTLAVDSAGRRLLVGGFAGIVRWYDIAPQAADDPPPDDTDDDAAAPQPRLLKTLRRPQVVWGAAVDDTNREIAVAYQNRVEVIPLDDDGLPADMPRQVLAPTVGPVVGVAFAEESPPYKIMLSQAASTTDDADAVQTFEFDLSAVRLERAAEIDRASYREPAAAAEGWSVRLEQTPTGPAHYLYQNEDRRGRLPLKGQRHGHATAAAWFDEPAGDDDDDPPSRKAVAVGTDGRGNIYVYEATEDDEAKLLRQFRDHSGTVLSLSTSSDGRYLLSGSADATVGVWNLADVFTADELENRWGAAFEVRDGNLVAEEVRRDGPLFFRGVRPGDRLVSLQWMDGHELQAAAEPEAMLQALRGVDFDNIVDFRFSRLGSPREGFLSYPAWQPLARLFVDRSREWALWTPAGFYEASFNGHELFGWQINRGVSALPDYFRAAQFRARLERPEVIRRLLTEGSLDAAMRTSVSGLAPPAGEGAIVNQFLNKPQIELIRPRDGQAVTTGEVTVEADIVVPIGGELSPPKVFAAGVPAVSTQRLSSSEEAGTVRHRYRWQVRLPRDRRVPLEILAATDSLAVGRHRIELDNRTPPSPRIPRLYLLAIGVSDYSDPQIQKLDFAARGARVVADLFESRTRGLYRTVTGSLTDRDAIHPLWREYAAQAAEELARDVGPDDLVVMYLCGHGLRDRRTDRWYFVTADSRYSDLMNDRYDGLLSFDDLASLSGLPCRKLAILDSCHSGAVQPAMREDDLKSALRFLQGDVVLTLTASEGEEEAAEETDRRLGRFTAHLVDALEGQADENGDGTVTLNEAVRYITAAVRDDSRAGGVIQTPTAGPAHWLQSIDLPLTRINLR